MGLEYPLELQPGKTYTIRVWTRRGDKATSPYYVNAQKTFRACSTNPRYCAESDAPGADGQLLVGGGKGVTMECRRWHKGYDSRRVCSF